jgi:thioesterase domain-containing protein/acyl carrier protein
VDRQALPATDGARSVSDESFIAPRNHLERQLANIWEKILAVQTIGVKDNFFDLGGHSLLAVRVTSQIEKIFGKKLSLTSFFQVPTVEQLANVLSNEVQLAPWSSLIPIQPNGSKPPFFWVHGEASDAFLSRYLDPDQPLYGILHQSHDGQPARYTTVQDIAAHYLSEIRTVQPQGPYFLGGYCFGAMVAFEMAQQLKNQDEKAAFLVLLSPCSLRHDQFMNHLPRNTSGASTHGRLSRDNFSRHLQNLKLLRPQDRLTYVLKKVKGATMLWLMEAVREIAEKLYLGLGYRLPPSLRSRYRMDIYDKANRAYVPEVYPGRLIIYKDKGSSDPRVWGAFAAGGFEIHEVPGDHFSVLTDRSVEIWGKQLSADLHRAQSDLRESEGREQKSEFGSRRSAEWRIAGDLWQSRTTGAKSPESEAGTQSPKC